MCEAATDFMKVYRRTSEHCGWEYGRVSIGKKLYRQDILGDYCPFNYRTLYIPS